MELVKQGRKLSKYEDEFVNLFCPIHGMTSNFDTPMPASAINQGAPVAKELAKASQKYAL